MTLPLIPRPIARGAGRCHVLAVQKDTGTMVAACGFACGGFCGDASFEPGVTHCHVHHSPICDDCAEIVREFDQTGEWTGVEPDPFYGYRRAVCWDPHCPNIVVLVESCWCFEHLSVCVPFREGDECNHPAHDCEAPVHFCESHQGGTS
jgi:hypothetical protein